MRRPGLRLQKDLKQILFYNLKVTIPSRFKPALYENGGPVLAITSQWLVVDLTAASGLTTNSHISQHYVDVGVGHVAHFCRPECRR